MSAVQRETIARVVLSDIVAPWHNYKEHMRNDTELTVRPDGSIVAVQNVKVFQERLNTASRELMRILGHEDYNLLTSLVEVAANARSLMDLERSRNGQ